MGKTLSKPICLIAGICYPAYASFKALESPSPHDDKQWLTYWAVYGICTSAETVSSRLFNWLPGYYVVKVFVLIWMMLPRTKVIECGEELICVLNTCTGCSYSL